VKDIVLFLPEIYLILTAIGLVLGEVGYQGERVRMILSTALLAVGGAFLQLVLNYVAGASRYGHVGFVNDGFGLFLKVLLLVSACIALLAERKSSGALDLDSSITIWNPISGIPSLCIEKA
jgi:NADH:ubiquinone oxidoreductase subunit 2 (subunit N)